MNSGLGSRSSDVVVIGAGIIGASIAWRLAQAGLRVTIVDAGVVGGEASWAGAGMLAPGGEYAHASEWTSFSLESLRLYPGFVDQLRAESGAEIDFRQCGAVELAFTAGEWDELRTRAAVQSGLGIRSEILDRDGLRELVPLLQQEVAGALLFSGDAVVNPRNVTYALQVACERRQAEIYENRQVTGIRLREESVEIDTGPGILGAARAVIAAGAWSSEIAVRRAGEMLPLAPSFPVKGHLLGYRMPAGSLRPILRHRGTYLVQRANGFTVAGSSEQRAGFDRTVDEEIGADIHRRACRILPCLADAPRVGPWIGFRPAAESLQPQIRRLGQSALWLSYGHYRNGILLAPATADRVSCEIIASLGKDSPARSGPR